MWETAESLGASQSSKLSRGRKPRPNVGARCAARRDSGPRAPTHGADGSCSFWAGLGEILATRGSLACGEDRRGGRCPPGDPAAPSRDSPEPGSSPAPRTKLSAAGLSPACRSRRSGLRVPVSPRFPSSGGQSALRGRSRGEAEKGGSNNHRGCSTTGHPYPEALCHQNSPQGSGG